MKSLLSEIGRDLLHAGTLDCLEGTAPVTVAAPDAGVRLNGQFLIMTGRHLIARLRQIIIFVDQSYVNPRRTGQAVVAVNAASLRGCRRESADHRIILLFRRRIYKAQQVLQILHAPHAGHHAQHAGPVQSVLNTLEPGQRLAKHMEVFNRCAQTRNVMLTLDCWQNVHPALVTIPADWDFAIPYGLLYAKNAPEDVLRFLDLIDSRTADPAKHPL